MFNPNLTPEQFQQAMAGARQGVQQLAREKDIASERLGDDELTLEDVRVHLALFKRLMAIVDDVLAVVEDAGDGYGAGEEEEGGAQEGGRRMGRALAGFRRMLVEVRAVRRMWGVEGEGEKWGCRIAV